MAAVGAAVAAETAAQETHNYLGFLYSFRRDWASASTHFVKAVDLGLPSNATGCRAGRWAVSAKP